jgi:hypothetical protein
MNDEYIDAKIAEAMAATSNNRHDAQKLLITWAVRDQALLLRMAKPHLKAIAAGLIEHALRAKNDQTETDNGPDNFSKTAIDDLVASATGGRIAEKRKNRNVPPPKSTERQASTMRRLAAAFTKKKK